MNAEIQSKGEKELKFLIDATKYNMKSREVIVIAAGGILLRRMGLE